MLKKLFSVVEESETKKLGKKQTQQLALKTNKNRTACLVPGPWLVIDGQPETTGTKDIGGSVINRRDRRH